MTSFDKIDTDAYHVAVQRAFSSSMLVRSSSEYNFRCSICGDSQKHKFKKRGYIYFGKGEWMFKCYNGTCPYKDGIGLIFVLKRHFPEIYKDLIFSGFSKTDRESIQKEPELKTNYKPTGLACFKEGELQPIYADLPLCKIALEFCEKRKIRREVYSKWFVCLKDDKFLSRDENGKLIYNEKGHVVGNEYGYRLIIPYYKYGGSWSQFDARDLRKDSALRYRNLEGVDKEFYNIDWLDVNKPFFLLEGSIDSTFIRNSVSFGGVKGLNRLLNEHPEIVKNKNNCVFIWDNDEAGYQQLEKTVEDGFKWFNWNSIKPSDEFKYDSSGNLRKIKDINDLVLYTDLMIRDDKEYITLDSLNRYIENPDPIKVRLLYGNSIKQNNTQKINTQSNNGNPFLLHLRRI